MFFQKPCLTGAKTSAIICQLVGRGHVDSSLSQVCAGGVLGMLFLYPTTTLLSKDWVI